LQLVKLFGREDIMVRSEYIALTDMDACTHCAGCVERCSFGARTFQDGAMAFVSEACVGCGLCVTACPIGAISMKMREPISNQNTIEQLIEQLQNTQAKLIALLESVADDQDWQPDPQKWSFRAVAAHLATVEKECFQVRVNRIAAGENPHFESYFNTDRDFSQRDLADSLQAWAATREEIIAFLGTLPPERWRFTGSYAAFGTITLRDVLQTMLEHDRQHTRQLEQIMAAYKS
jgi:ferredoxin